MNLPKVRWRAGGPTYRPDVQRVMDRSSRLGPDGREVEKPGIFLTLQVLALGRDLLEMDADHAGDAPPANFLRSAAATDGGTTPKTSPPRRATSLTMRLLM